MISNEFRMPDTFTERAIQKALKAPEGEDVSVMITAFEAADIRAEYKRRNPPEKEKTASCSFGVAWYGPCGNPLPCDRHKDLKCKWCDKPAVHECSEYGSFGFVCGNFECENHCCEKRHR